MEMTNNFATKQMEHIMMLTKELHKGQIGPDVTMLCAIFQQTLNFHAMPTRKSGAPDTHGFEEVLKSLPTQKVKVFVDGIQSLMDRAKSLQDMLVETERQNERRKAQARIEAERKINEQKTQELMAEIARLKSRLGEGNSGYATSYSYSLPPIYQACQPEQQRQYLQMATGASDSEPILQRQLASQRLQALQPQQQMQKQPAETDTCGRPLHMSNYAGSLDPALSSGGAGLEQNAASASDSTEPLTKSPSSGWDTAQSHWMPPPRTDQAPKLLSPIAQRGRKRAAKASSATVRLGEDMSPPREEASTVTGSSWLSEPSSKAPSHTDQTDGEGRKRPGSAAFPEMYGGPVLEYCVPYGQVGRPLDATYIVPSRSETDESMPAPASKRLKTSNDPLPGPASTDSPEGHQGKVLTKNRLQMAQMVGTFNEVLHVGRLVLKAGSPPAFEPTETG